MKTDRLLPLLGLALLTPTFSARSLAQEQDTPKARAVIERFLAVTKWGKAIEGTSVRHEVGKISFGGFDGTTESWASKPDNQHVTIVLGGFGEMLSGYHGGHAWISGPMTGSYLLTGTDLLQTRTEATYNSPAKPEGLYESLETLGKATFEGQVCWKLECVARADSGMDAEKTKKARTVHEYYAIDSGYLVGVEGFQEGDIVTGPYSRAMSGYKEFEGVLYPSQTRLRQGAVDMQMTLVSVEFDPPDAGDHLPPIEIQTMIKVATKEASGPAAGEKAEVEEVQKAE